MGFRFRFGSKKKSKIKLCYLIGGIKWIIWMLPCISETFTFNLWLVFKTVILDITLPPYHNWNHMYYYYWVYDLQYMMILIQVKCRMERLCRSCVLDAIKNSLIFPIFNLFSNIHIHMDHVFKVSLIMLNSVKI